MQQILRLEYSCTNAEMEQAQSLILRKQLGGGSKWRARLVLLVLLVGLLLGFYFRFQEIPAVYRVMIIAAVPVCSVLLVFYKRIFHKTDPAPIKVEISEMDFSILGPASKVTVPWSAFSQCLESADLFVLLDRPKKTLVVVPKRAFPDESSQTWFREQATYGVGLTTPQPREAPIISPFTAADRVTFTVRLGFRDYLDRTIASWLTWGVVLVVAGLLIGMTLYSAAHPPPDAVNSSTKVFFMFVLPFFLVLVVMIILIFSIHGWRSHARYSTPQEIALSEESVVFAGADASGTLPWASFTYYKETWWSFILWRGSHWVMFPKRAFASWDDLNRCRDLLDRHLRRSRWFLG